jgi:hypothetical protein
MTPLGLLLLLLAWTVAGACLGWIIGRAATLDEDGIFTDEDARW